MDTEAFIDDEKKRFTWTDDTSWTEEDLHEKLLALNGYEGDDISDWTTSEISGHAVAEYVVVRILVRTEHETQARRLRSDFGIGNEYAIWPAEAGIIATPDCTLSVDRLKNLITEGIFQYTCGEKDDSPQTQWLDFMDNAHTVAAKLLLNEDEAIAESIRQAARTHLGHLLPRGPDRPAPQEAGTRAGDPRRGRRRAPERLGGERHVNRNRSDRKTRLRTHGAAPAGCAETCRRTAASAWRRNACEKAASAQSGPRGVEDDTDG